jgi:quinol monooxygenase YgiN
MNIFISDKHIDFNHNLPAMKKILPVLLILFAVVLLSAGFNKNQSGPVCTYNKDSMIVVMKFERKVKPEYVALLKKSFDACKAEMLAKEPGCLDYSLFQSYNDSTLFCLTEAWKNKGAHNEHMKLAHTIKHIAEIKGINDPSFRSKTSYTYWICPGANQVK